MSDLQRECSYIYVLCKNDIKKFYEWKIAVKNVKSISHHSHIQIVASLITVTICFRHVLSCSVIVWAALLKTFRCLDFQRDSQTWKCISYANLFSSAFCPKPLLNCSEIPVLTYWALLYNAQCILDSEFNRRETFTVFLSFLEWKKHFSKQTSEQLSWTRRLFLSPERWDITGTQHVIDMYVYVWQIWYRFEWIIWHITAQTMKEEFMENCSDSFAHM